MNSLYSLTNVMNGNYQPPVQQRKRTYSGTDHQRRKFDGTKAPPLPPALGDLVLQAFTHKSLRQCGVSPEHYGDNERLAGLGESVFDVELTRYLFKRRPLLRATDLAIQRRMLRSSGMLQDWVKHYSFIKRLVASKDAVMNADEEGVTVFFAYVGALFTSSGPEAVHCWIDCLLSQEVLIQPEIAIKPDPSMSVSTPAPKRIKSETPPPSISSWRAPPPTSSYTTRPAHHSTQPTLPSSSASGLHTPRIAKPNPPNPLAPAQPQAAFLPLFNQAATKRKVTVEYLAEFTGLKHAGNWKVKCIVNGICKGEGTSSHKQTAKEEAARNAYYSMGWQ